MGTRDNTHLEQKWVRRRVVVAMLLVNEPSPCKLLTHSEKESSVPRRVPQWQENYKGSASACCRDGWFLWCSPSP